MKKPARRRARDHHLQRLEYRGFAGWVVQITRGREMVCSEYFSDRRHGGRAGSLRKARRRRDQRLRALPPPVLAKLRHAGTTTGVVGVNEVWRRGRDGGRLCYYVGNWVWPPRSRHQVRKTFSVQKYGKRLARELAVAARREALKRTALEERRLLLQSLRRETTRA